MAKGTGDIRLKKLVFEIVKRWVRNKIRGNQMRIRWNSSSHARKLDLRINRYIKLIVNIDGKI